MDNNETRSGFSTVPLDILVRGLPHQKPGQARTMLICETKKTVPAEVGHWYSPEKVAELIAAEREACAKVCDDEADRMEQAAQQAIENGEHDEVSAIRSTAWKLSVAANRIRARSNVEVRGAAK